jgi:hypothetical protein
MTFVYWLVWLPLAVAFVVGAAILIRRHGSRRASVALAGLATIWLYDAVLHSGLVDWSLITRSPDTLAFLITAMSVVRNAGEGTCVVLLVYLAVSDRSRMLNPVPEADYDDRPAAR